MKIVAKSKDGRMLELIDSDYGRVVNTRTGYVGPVHSIASILRWGAWDEEFGDPIEVSPVGDKVLSDGQPFIGGIDSANA